MQYNFHLALCKDIDIFCERTIAGGIDSVHKINVIV